jgi:hypothetical protein
VDEYALERAKARIADAASGRVAPAELEAAVERSRAQIEALAVAAADLETTLPERIGAAVQDGLRTEVVPVARHLAEIRGLLNQAIRRLERLEGDLLAERHARVDDLALLVDLVSSGWKGVSDRLEKLERGVGGASLVVARDGLDPARREDEPKAAAPPHLGIELDPAA